MGWSGSHGLATHADIFPWFWGLSLLLSQGTCTLFAQLKFMKIEEYLEKQKFSAEHKVTSNCSWCWGPVKQDILTSSRHLPKTSYHCVPQKRKPRLLGLPASNSSHLYQPASTRALVFPQLKAESREQQGQEGSALAVSLSILVDDSSWH